MSMSTSFNFYWPAKKIDEVLKCLKSKKASFWEKKGEEMALKLFRFVCQTVPAYRQFLKEKGVDSSKIKTIADFQELPVIDKESYLKKYPYLDLFPGRDLSKITTISATSGSTGVPFYFPRGEQEDRQYEYAAEVFLRNQFEIDKKRTLGVIGFGLGIWVGGIFTYKNLNKLAQKGYSLSLVPVGPNKELFLKSLQKFGRLFDQVILMGYPPFIKDVVDEAPDFGVNWRDYKIRILTAAEGFSEEFRDYLAEKTGLKNPLNDVINIYGTVELGTMAHETVFANLIRKIAVSRPAVFKKIFPEVNRQPTLAQYHPNFVRFEEVGREIVGTGYGSSIPLIRYRFPDIGGVIGFEEMITKLKEGGVDIFREARDQGIAGKILRLPFVYVYERSDSAATLLGILIYPEYIKAAFQGRFLTKAFTGKFTMTTKYDRRQNQFLEIHVELKKSVRPTATLKSAIQKAIIKSLVRGSTEYSYLYDGGEKQRQRLVPKIFLHPYEYSLYFTPGAKQKWVKKTN